MKELSFRSALLRAGVIALLVLAQVPLASHANDLPVAKPESVGMSSERLARIVPAMQKLVEAGKLPGVVTIIARRGKVVHFEAIGQQNVEQTQPMTTDTIFRMYSQTKPVTGVATLILYEEGHFLLSDPIAKYLPELENMRVYKGEKNGQIETEPARPITIHHLLTHTSGLTYDLFPTPVSRLYAGAGVSGLPHRGTQGNLEEWSRDLAKLPLVAQPGSEWSYGVSMDVLGRLVEVVSGKTFGEFMKERIFAPLGMNDTAFYVPEGKRARFAANYGPTPDGKMTRIDDPANSPYLVPPKVELGGAGLVSTASDYLRFAQMLANGGELEGVRILSPKTVDLMMSNNLSPELPPDPLTSLFRMLAPGTRMWGYGFGLTGFVVTDPALTGLPGSQGSFGWGGAASTDFWVDREEELVGMVLTQLLPAGTYPTRQLMQVLTYQAIVE